MATIETRVSVLERELGEIKKMLIARPFGQQRISLKGKLKGASFGLREVQAAKRSLFRSLRAK